MTLPTDVAEAVAKADQYAGTYEHGFAVKNAWDTIRAHLLSQEAEIERLRANNDKLYREHVALQDATVAAESRLAAANALLRDIKDWDVNQSQGAY